MILRNKGFVGLAALLIVGTTACGDGIAAPEPTAEGGALVGYLYTSEFESQIRAVSIEGVNQRLISDTTMSLPSASSTGDQLIGGRSDEVTSLDLATGAFTVLIRIGREPNLIRADWSPDDSRVVFTSAEYYEAPNIFVMDAIPGSNPVLLSPGENPIWSPAHDSIAFEAWVNGVNGLAIMSTEGTGLRLISAYGESGKGVSPGGWSPDGAAIVGSRSTSPGHYALFILTRDGSRLTQLTTPPDGTSDSSARWSPDGKLVAFIRYREVGPGSPRGPGSDQVMVVDAKGGEPRQLVSACQGCGEDINHVFWIPETAPLPLTTPPR